MARSKKTPTNGKNSKAEALPEAEQEEFDAPGMEPASRVFNAAVDPKAKKYCHALRQRKLWEAIAANAKPFLDAAMEAEGLTEYHTKRGDTVFREGETVKIRVVLAKDEDGKMDRDGGAQVEASR
jgi:hypothetical protein